MRQQRLFRTATFLVIGLLAVFGQGTVRATNITYTLSADTSALNGYSGYIDFQFNPGDSSAEFATATVNGFQTTGAAMLASSSVNTGDAIGSLPGTLTFDNGTLYNDIFQGITFGTGLSFGVTLSGPAVDSPGGTVGSSFALSFYAADTVTPLLTTASNGSVLTLNLNANGTTAPQSFPQSPTDNSPIAGAVPAAATPEPSSMLLFATLLPATLTVLRRRRVHPRA